IALSWPDSAGLSAEEKTRAVVTGNPVRPEIAALFTRPYPKLEQDGTLRILIIGGSLGASVFGKILPQTFAQLPRDYRARLHIVQQCREEDIDMVREAYETAGIKADLSLFIDDMATELDKAHLVIARSGASTVAEITTAGRPAIFVPYPHHADQQQKMNADSIADTGGAWTIVEAGFTPESVLPRIETFMQDPSILFRTAEKASACAKPDAARKLGNLVTAIASGWGEEE
ncbi:MAG: UDP-N-acetylglucosamine--N-acetylmuramyl-(pentapeptide) pyrophosphoryl-undecaprenol N-acetylglucosamine transferase, partial [Bdellovibrionales bacterium]